MKKTTCFLAALAGVFFVFAASACAFPSKEGAAERDELYEKLGVLAEVIDIVEKGYVEDVDAETLVHGAIEGILKRLDPHSTFMTSHMFKEMKVETEGEFGGLGIEVSMRDGVLTVVSPIEDTPAHKAGIMAGDMIVRIEDKKTRGMTLMDAVGLMRGEKGEKITIHIMREGFETPKAFTIARDIIKIASVKSKKVGDVGVVRISQFHKETHAEALKAVEELGAEGPLDGLVLDLRNNPGGASGAGREGGRHFPEARPHSLHQGQGCGARGGLHGQG